MKSKETWTNIFLILLTVVAVVVIPTVGTILGSINSINKMEVNINRLHNNIIIEQEEILEIQTEMKAMVQEYTGYEESSNKLVVENLDPKFIVNMYPELKSSNMYNNLNRQYLSSMRKIKDSKSDYNNAVETYNQRLVTFKGKLIHGDKQLKEFIK